jgi:glycosyltransferase involved in cell wall biosynthesis
LSAIRTYWKSHARSIRVFPQTYFLFIGVQIGGNAEIIKSERNGLLLLTAFDVKALANSTISLLRVKILKGNLAGKLRELLKSFFVKKKFAEETCNLYKQNLNKYQVPRL